MDDRVKLPLRDWSYLPNDVIHLIVSRIKSVEDLMSISAVCHSWRSETVKDYSARRYQFPWMMIFPRYIFERKGLFSFDKHKHYDIVFQNPEHSRYWGSSVGVLIILSLSRQFHLYNPVTKTHLNLPPKPIFRGECNHNDLENHANSIPGYVRKALVFKDEGKFVVVAIGSVSGDLSFASPGDESWVHVKAPFGRILSAVWCKGRLFFMLGLGALICYERNDEGIHEAKEVATAGNVGIWDNIGLVESSGDIFLVIRHSTEKEWYKTVSFCVSRLDFENKKWVETNDLGDCALFLDADDNAVALKASEAYNCKSNCIYYVEKHWDRYGRYLGGPDKADMGIFHLKDTTIEPLFVRDPFNSSQLLHNPIWLMPSLC